ncbi:hypothetical protein GC176_06890 [bacterium]|nr:hypothetical protein [bacterium]
MNGLKKKLRQTTQIAVFGVTVVLSSLQITSAVCADEIRLSPVENFSTVFAGDEVMIAFHVKAEQPVEGKLNWSHSAEQRTLDRGEVAVRRGPDGDSEVSFRLRLPEVRDGIIYPTTLTAEFLPPGENTPMARHERTLWLFPRKPLFGRSAWAESLDLDLFDANGKTAEALASIDLPSQALRAWNSVRIGAASDEANQNGILLVGEGAALGNGSLIETAVEAALAGRRVIVLAPRDGSFEMPGLSEDATRGDVRAGEVRITRNSVITEFDKRLDTQAWLGVGNRVPFRGLRIEAVRGRLRADITGDGNGWPWIELRYPGSGGVLIVCGFRIVEHWEHGPTPRYLLVRMLESLSRTEPAVVPER